MRFKQLMRRLGWWTLGLMFVWILTCMLAGFWLFGLGLSGRGTDTGSPDREALEQLPRMLSTYFVVFFGGTALLWLVSICLIYGASVVNALNNRSIRVTGESAEAIILKVSETGMSINDDPVVRLLLDVGPPGQPRFQAEAERLVSRLDIPQFQPGKAVQVKYDPKSKAVAVC